MIRKFPLITSSLFFCLLFAASHSYAQTSTLGVQEGPGLRVNLGIDQRAELFPEDRWQGISVSGYSGTLMRRPVNWTRNVALDSTSTYVVATEAFNGKLVRQQRSIPVSEYMELSSAHNQRKMWRESALQNLLAERQRQGGSGGINIEIPVEIKSRAFQKIFGGDRVGLNVQGEIRIDGGFRNENRSEVKTSIAQGSNTNFKMNQTQRFTVTGKIGEKVTVNVDQDSERTLDFENNIKLNYKGFEDEVIQSIEAGNISLSLPATRFVTFSGKSTGLFGVKMDMQLGDLHLTTIASQEKGESQKLTAGGGATGNQRQIRDYEFRRYTYFFLSDEHRDQYRQYAFKWQHVYDPAIALRRIEIYKSLPGYQEKPEAIQGFALPNPANQADTSRTEKEYYRGHFIRLEPDRDYFVENNLGYIVMNQPLNEDEVLAVAYEDSSLRKVGDIDYDFTSNQPIFLKIIKAQSPQPSYRNTWNLEWKNVYYLGSRNIEKEGFEIKIFKKAEGAGTDNESQGADSYLKIFGLDTRDVSGGLNPDGKLDDDPNIINWARGELIMPYLRPFDPREDVIIGGTAEPSVLDQADFEPVIYDTTSQRWITQNSNFYFEFTSTSASTNYNLGFNVIEDSEEVILNGDRLVRGQGYTIDYWSGTLNVLDSRASLPNAQVDITYERNQLFQLQKKTILGTRAEYRFGRDSFLGGTLLYLNERTLDQKVRVGSGPMRNLVWDLNTSLKFEPNFLTTALDALPLIDATQPSRLNFEGEIAQVLPNPNTLNSEQTGDQNGVAYIDDFEGAKRTTPLGVHRRGYTLASAPEEHIPGSVDVDYNRSVEKMGQLNWFNPFSGVDKREIYPNQEVNSQTGFTQDVLTLRFTPKTGGLFAPQESWGGVMRALSPGFFDQTESKFLEVMVKGDVGVLHINLGQISEDVIPNKKFDTEDRLRGGIREGRLDDDEDIGLDGMTDTDPRAVSAGGDFWDINNNGTKEPFEPFSNDNWFYQTQSNDYDLINGTENNANDGTREPDTEDLNGNGTTDLANNYFEYAFNLDKFSADTVFIAGGQGLPWRLYRLPLGEPTKVVGAPDLGLTEYIRIWIDGVDTETEVSIAEINLVGNEWRELNREDEQLAVAVINTHENPEYIQPPGVEGVRDRITQVQAREQSLVLKINNLVPDSLVMAQKSFFEAQNYIHYARMRMFVYADDFTGQHMLPTVGSEPVEADTANSDIVFFMRFGTNDQNYYEFRELVFSGDGTTTGAWNPRNEMDIELSELTNLKFTEAYLNYLTRRDSLRYFEQQIGPTKWYRIKGEPSLTNVRVIYAGVENLGKMSSMPFSGEIWLNELRLSDVEKEKGIAMRARMDLGLSDFISVNAEINRQDADFHNVGTRFGTGDNRTAATLNGNVKLDKLLPKNWGISLPLTLNYSESESTPKYAPGKDILITDDTPTEEVDASRSTSVQKGFGLSFNKSTRSKNFFVKHTVDNIRASVSQTLAEQTSPTIETSQRTAWAGNVDYSLQFGQKTFVQPFKFLAGLPLLKNVGETRLYYLPRNFNGKISGNLSKTNSLTRLGAATNVYTYDLTRSYSTNIKIFENLSGSFARNWRGDARESGWMGLFNGDIEDLDKGQTVNADYSPQLFNWLNNKLSYSSNFRFTNNITNQRTGRSAGTSTNLSANMTLKFSELFKFSSSPPGATTRRRTPPGRRRTPPGQRQGEEEKKTDAEEGQEDSKEDEESREEKIEKRRANPINAIKLIGKALSNFRDINFTASRRKNISNIGLEEGNPSFEYMLGFTNDPGLGIVPDVSTNTFTENVTESFSASTGMQLSRNFDLTLRFTHDEQRNETTQVTGNYSDSWLRIGDFDLPFPEWTLSISGLEKLPILSFAKNITASHNFTGKRSVVWKNDRDQTTKEDFSISFRPLLKVSISLNNGMQTNFQIDRTRGFNNTFNPIFIDDFLELRQVGGQRSTQQNISFSANYSKRGGLKLPFFKNPLRNTIDFSVTFNMNSTINESIRGESNEYVVSSERSSWTFEPRMTYSFSNRVRGGTHFQIGKTKSTLAGDVSIKEFGIDVNISIRGQ